MDKQNVPEWNDGIEKTDKDARLTHSYHSYALT